MRCFNAHVTSLETHYAKLITTNDALAVVSKHWHAIASSPIDKSSYGDDNWTESLILDIGISCHRIHISLALFGVTHVYVPCIIGRPLSVSRILLSLSFSLYSLSIYIHTDIISYPLFPDMDTGIYSHTDRDTTHGRNPRVISQC